MAALFVGDAMSAAAQSLLVEDFGKDDSAWSQVRFPDAHGTFDTSSGSYEFFMPSSAKLNSGTGALFLGSVWTGSNDLRFQDGFWRATLRAETPKTAVGMGLRVAPDNPFVAYPFFAIPELGKAMILKAEDGSPPVPLAEMDIDMQANENWVMEAGAVGSELSLKMWREGTPEPTAPQLIAQDSTFDSGVFALAADVFPDFDADLGASFDNIFFTKQSSLSDNIHIVSPRGLVARDGTSRIPGPTFPVRVQMLYPSSDFESVPESHRVITGLSLRPDPSNQFAGASSGPITVRLSTTANDALSLTYADNTGPDETTVFDGQIVWQSDSAGQFDYVVNFSRPFAYNPTDGNLVVDLSTPGLRPGSSWWTDNEFPTGPNTTFVGGGYDEPAATDAFASLFPLQFKLSRVELRAGDADQDLDFDQADLVQVQIAAKYLTGESATWGEGDWNAAPAGTLGNPAPGNGLFDQNDIVAALQAGAYLTGPYFSRNTDPSKGDGFLELNNRLPPALSVEAVREHSSALTSLTEGGELRNVEVVDVPEPSAALLLILGAVAIALGIRISLSLG